MSKFKVGDIVTGVNSWQCLGNGRTGVVKQVVPGGYKIGVYGETPMNGGFAATWMDSELSLIGCDKGTQRKFSVGDVVEWSRNSQCGTFDSVNGSYMVITKVHDDYYSYDILDETGKVVDNCYGCETGDHENNLRLRENINN